MKNIKLEKEVTIQPITPPEPDLTPQEMIQRAKDLVPYLRERGPEMEQNRRISDEVNQVMIDKGFYRILQPRVFGGYEFDFHTYCDTVMELARGETSVGWVVGFSSGHSIQAAQLPLAGQIEVFGQDGDFRAPIVTNPFGEGKEVEGGYVISGNWNYNSGGEVSNWLGVYVQVPIETDEGPSSEMRACFIRNTEYDVVDNWHVLGMRGTGSKQAVAKDVFVPKERSFSWSNLNTHFKAPGHGVHKNPIYQTPTSPILATQISAVTVGVAQAAIDAFIEYAETKKAPFPPFPVLKEERRAHDALGRAMGKLEAAKACVFTLADRQMQRAKRVNTDDTFTKEEVMMDIVLCQQVGALSVETVNTIYDAMGSRGAYQGSLLEKIFRDINMIRTHYYMDHTRTAENLGALGFGFTPKGYL
jgi:3-hydroxy-9,10-secoandrosta-1,3,5(10)-triene-9,17-dione monooxygenase